VVKLAFYSAFPLNQIRTAFRRRFDLVKISGVVIALNEEHNIGRCLDSMFGVADEIVVVDSYSTDKTADICVAKGARLVKHSFEGHIEQKNYAMSTANHDHILSLDADEALSDELKASIIAAKQNWECDAYWVNRMTNYCGKWIRHSGWYPDKKIRLWDRKKGQWGGVNPHDRVIMEDNKSTDRLLGDLLHYSYSSLSHHVANMNSFSNIAAQAAYDQGNHTLVFRDLLCLPFLTFFKKYILQFGLLDGYYGFLIAVITAFGRFLKYAKLREIGLNSAKQHIKKV
jgi:glycosyltransferase involved in cell wall biosynthesis